MLTAKKITSTFRQQMLLKVVILIGASLLVSIHFPSLVLSQSLLPQPGEVYTIQANDSLSSIANTAYGDPQLFRAIVVYNNRKAQSDPDLAFINNPGALAVGWRIYLPTVTEISEYQTDNIPTVTPINSNIVTATLTPRPTEELASDRFQGQNGLIDLVLPTNQPEVTETVEPTQTPSFSDSDDDSNNDDNESRSDVALAQTDLRETPSTATLYDPLGLVEVEANELIHLAYMLDFSGEASFLGREALTAIQMALEDWGSIAGRDVTLVGADTGCSLRGGQTVAERVTQDGRVVAAIGTTCFVSALTAIPIISQAGFTMVSPSNTGPDLTDPNELWWPGYFRTAHNDLDQARLAANYAYKELDARTVATIHDDTDYTFQLQEAFVEQFELLGGRQIFEGAIPLGQTSIELSLRAMSRQRPDVLYFPIFDPEAFYVVTQAREIASLNRTALMMADGLFSPAFAPAAGLSADGVYLSAQYLETQRYIDFKERYEAETGDAVSSDFVAYAYDAAWLLLTAIEIVMIEQDDTLYIGRQALRDALTDLQGVAALSGNLNCSQYGDCSARTSLAIYQLGSDQITSSRNWPPPMIYLDDDE